MDKMRFADLRKVPKQPALRLVALGNSKLKSKLSTPANASVSDVLTALDQAGDVEAAIDMVRLMAMALPARERVWWACLAAQDVVNHQGIEVPLPLKLCEQWVRKPSDELRDKVREAADIADIDDPSVMCAMAVVFYDDTLGTGDLAQYPSPPGAAQNATLAMVSQAISIVSADPIEACKFLVDRAVDISRGGNGQLDLPKAKEPVS